MRDRVVALQSRWQGGIVVVEKVHGLGLRVFERSLAQAVFRCIFVLCGGTCRKEDVSHRFENPCLS